jgi:NarL family two-component system response regulator LiaR
MKKIRVLVVDDQPVVQEGIVAILSYQSDIEVVGQAEDGAQTLELARQTRPDVVLLDLVMPRQDGLTTIPMLRAAVPETRILVLTSFAENERVFQAIKAGALGYLLKDATWKQLLQAIHDVAEGKASLHPSIALKLMQEISNPSETPAFSEQLTLREKETLQLIGRGMSNKEIAAKLHVNERTVAKKVSSILQKLHLANRTQAALYAVREGIASLPEASEQGQ